MIIATALTICIVTDLQFSSQNLPRFLPGYVALAVHAISSSALDHTWSLLTPSLGPTFTVAASTLGASAFALPFYIFRTVAVRVVFSQFAWFHNITSYSSPSLLRQHYHYLLWLPFLL